MLPCPVSSGEAVAGPSWGDQAMSVTEEFDGGLRTVADGATGPLVSEDGLTISRTPSGILRMTVPAGTTVEVSHVEAVAVLVRQLANGDRLPMLLDMTGVAAVHKDASTAYMTSRTVTAYAVLGRTPVDRVLVHFSLGTGTPTMPAQFFTSEMEALAWLEDQVDRG